MADTDAQACASLAAGGTGRRLFSLDVYRGLVMTMLVSVGADLDSPYAPGRGAD